MRKADLLALAARVEAAAGADREMDAEIARAAGHKAHDRGKLGWTIQFNGQGIHHNLPAFTSSLDAAASLVPEGCEWRVETLGMGERQAGAIVCRRDAAERFPGVAMHCAATPALALTAAALRAMAEEASDD